MIKVAICDDTPYVGMYIKKIIDEHSFNTEMHVDVYDSGKKLLQSIENSLYHIVFMDIQLTSDGPSDKLCENGMLLADYIKDKYPESIIIFLSQFPQYKSELLRHEPYGFIQKPPLFTSDSQMIQITETAIDRVLKRESRDLRYYIKYEGVFYGFDTKEILYIQSMSPYVIFFYVQRTAQSSWQT